MSRKKVLLENPSKPSNWWECKCGNYSEMGMICEGVYDSRDHDYDYEEWMVSSYKVLRCPSCKDITILRYTTYGNEYGFDIEPEPGPQFTTYYYEVLYGPARSWHYSIPKAITDVLVQAEGVIQNSPRAAFILCRAAIEQLCDEFSIPSHRDNNNGQEFLNLKKRLNLLIDQQKLSKDLRNVLHGIRDLGNVGAHGSSEIFINDVSHDDASHLIDLAEYVLDKLYVQPKLIDEAQSKLEALLLATKGKE